MMLSHFLESEFWPDAGIEESADGWGFEHLQNEPGRNIEIAVDLAALVLRLQRGDGHTQRNEIPTS